MKNPALQTLTERAHVTRSVTHECTPEEFEPVARRIDAGLDWGVGGIVTDDSERVLLIREHDRWQTPGGEVEPGEDHHEALQREVAEETGIRASPGELVGVTENRYVCGDEERAFAFAHYTATPVGDTSPAPDPGLVDEDIEAVEWHTTLPADTLQSEIIRHGLP